VVRSNRCPNCLEGIVEFSASRLANICKKCGYAMPPECYYTKALVKEELLKDPALRREYDKLQPKYDRIARRLRQIINKRRQGCQDTK